jgi:hypothetical protein
VIRAIKAFGAQARNERFFTDTAGQVIRILASVAALKMGRAQNLEIRLTANGMNILCNPR